MVADNRSNSLRTLFFEKDGTETEISTRPASTLLLDSKLSKEAHLCYNTYMSDSLLPATITLLTELALTTPTIENLTTTDNPPLEQVRKADMLQLNFELALLHSLWDTVETLPAALILLREQRELRKDRRALLGLPYGSPQNNSSKVVTWEPLP